MTSEETVFNVDGKRFLYRKCGLNNVPLVLLFAHEPACRQTDVLLCLDLDWNDDLTPWPYENFQGHGFEFAETVHKALTEIDPHEEVICAGYSLGGLFALYAPAIIPQITRIAAASPSVWYPGYVDHLKKYGMAAQVKEISLSVGRKEHKALAAMEQVLAALQDIPTHFVLEKGGHFHEPQARLARTIDQLSWKEPNC